jgi:hypothetical protein
MGKGLAEPQTGTLGYPCAWLCSGQRVWQGRERAWNIFYVRCSTGMIGGDGLILSRLSYHGVGRAAPMIDRNIITHS